MFETGYGPSGLPHIGTFSEVARTSMVRHAFRVLTEDKIKTRLIEFSDDMDGLRKVPDNIPNKELVAAHLGKPLTEVPDPFGTHASFGAHNNARLRAFLDEFGFELRIRFGDQATIGLAASTPRSSTSWLITTKSWRSCCRAFARSVPLLIHRFCRFIQGLAL